MKKTIKSRPAKRTPKSADAITTYGQVQPPPFRALCELLRRLVDAALPQATARVWHGSPVWFIDDNPVVGYNATAKSVNLLFWNGQAFGEPDLKPVGKYGAAQVVFSDVAEMDPKAIRRWLKLAKTDVFDSKAFFRKLREGK